MATKRDEFLLHVLLLLFLVFQYIILLIGFLIAFCDVSTGLY